MSEVILGGAQAQTEATRESGDAGEKRRTQSAWAVLDFIARSETLDFPPTRAEIAEGVGLSFRTVSKRVNELFDDGLIGEEGPAGSGAQPDAMCWGSTEAGRAALRKAGGAS